MRRLFSMSYIILCDQIFFSNHKQDADEWCWDKKKSWGARNKDDNQKSFFSVLRQSKQPL